MVLRLSQRQRGSEGFEQLVEKARVEIGLLKSRQISRRIVRVLLGEVAGAEDGLQLMEIVAGVHDGLL
jgi:hypothetical protein